MSTVQPDTSATLGSPLRLPCGVTLANRIAKGAMSEQLGSRMRPGKGIRRLYRCWAEGGAGMLLTGNVMVDRRFVESHKNIAIDDPVGTAFNAASFADWAAVTEGTPTQLWVQLNHPGRQCPRHIHPHPPAPSEGPSVALFRAAKAFGKPRAMTESEIHDVIGRFALGARRVQEAGFDGVQLHGAHGYLVSQFLSPLTNVRDDKWGGSLENRARFCLAVVAAMRAEVGPSFPVSVKLNSADFQRGGFDEDDALCVLSWLAEAGVDLVEISGGSYESKAMFDLDGSSTSQREAYFLDFARRARAAVDVPLMVTGGFRSRAVMDEALATGALDVVGMARPFANDPDIARKLLNGDVTVARQPTRRFPGRTGRAASEAMLSVVQMALMSGGVSPTAPVAGVLALAKAAVRPFRAC